MTAATLGEMKALCFPLLVISATNICKRRLDICMFVFVCALCVCLCMCLCVVKIERKKLSNGEGRGGQRQQQGERTKWFVNVVLTSSSSLWVMDVWHSP